MDEGKRLMAARLVKTPITMCSNHNCVFWTDITIQVKLAKNV